MKHPLLVHKVNTPPFVWQNVCRALPPFAEEKEDGGPKVVLNGSDGNGRALQGQDAVFENSKQWHATAFPSYLQSKKDDFCLNWEEAMQVRPPIVTSCIVMVERLCLIIFIQGT